MKEMQGMNIIVNHQFHEHNQTADILVHVGENGQNDFYENFQDLPHHIKGIIWTNKLDLPYIRT